MCSLPLLWQRGCPEWRLWAGPLSWALRKGAAVSPVVSKASATQETATNGTECMGSEQQRTYLSSTAHLAKRTRKPIEWLSGDPATIDELKCPPMSSGRIWKAYLRLQSRILLYQISLFAAIVCLHKFSIPSQIASNHHLSPLQEFK